MASVASCHVPLDHFIADTVPLITDYYRADVTANSLRARLHERANSVSSSRARTRAPWPLVAHRPGLLLWAVPGCDRA